MGLFKEALAQIWSHRRFVLSVMLPIYVVAMLPIWGSFFLVERMAAAALLVDPEGLNTFLFLLSVMGVGSLIFAFLVSPVAAVLWHQRVLRGQGFGAHHLRFKIYVAYLLNAFLLFMILLALVAIFVLLPGYVVFDLTGLGEAIFERTLESSALALTFDIISGIFAVCLGAVFAYVFVRLGVCLPALCVGDLIGFSQSRDLTRPLRREIFVAAVLISVVTSFDLLLPYSDGFDLWVELATALLILLEVSLLTAVYGHVRQGNSDLSAGDKPGTSAS